MPIMGCTDSAAINYFADANVAIRDNDGSATCRYAGCTDSMRHNYDPSATTDAGCTPAFVGCTLPAALNFVAAPRCAGPLEPCFYDPTCPEVGGSSGSLGCNAGGLAGCRFCGFASYSDIACSTETLVSEIHERTTGEGSHTDSQCIGSLYSVNDGSCSIPGCMMSHDAQFNAQATFDDGSCDAMGSRRQMVASPSEGTGARRRVHLGRQLGMGCMDPTASNYDPFATSNSGCTYEIRGCTDSTASNHLPIAQAERSPSDCVYPIPGCTDATALNFDSTANELHSCLFPQPGCTFLLASNFLPAANVEDGSCVFDVVGCMSARALNFDSLATRSEGCRWVVRGCADSAAANYAADVNMHEDASCSYVVRGCRLPLAINFNSNATLDDGSCVIDTVPRIFPPPHQPPPHQPRRPPPRVLPAAAAVMQYPPLSPPLRPTPLSGPTPDAGGWLLSLLAVVVGVLVVLVAALAWQRRQRLLRGRKRTATSSGLESAKQVDQRVGGLQGQASKLVHEEGAFPGKASPTTATTNEESSRMVALRDGKRSDVVRTR